MQNHYPRRALALIIIPTLFTALSTVMVVLRIMGRRIKRTSLWLDDYTIVAALCFVYPLMILMVVSATNLGAGRHIQELSHHTVVLLLKVGLSAPLELIATQLTWCVSVGLVKLGILLSYLRIFNAKEDRVATRIMMGVAMCWMLSAVLGAFLQCRPFSYIWNQHQEGNCTARVRFWVAIGVSHLVIDILILLLPVRMVWKLQVSRNTKIVLICIISGFRLRTLYEMDGSDPSYHLPIPHIWSVLEPTVAICTASLPIARPVFLRVLPSSSTPTPPTGHSFRPKSLESHGLAEETAVGPFRRLNEH
ncbi:hypothetical protein MMC29_005779 [Sticta canariensis]|nr:hypothetical protein [Sticta canariensis]